MVPTRCMVKSAMAELPILKIIWRIKIILIPTQWRHKMTYHNDVIITLLWRHCTRILTTPKQACNLWICFICTIYSDNMDIKYLIKLFHESSLLSQINESYQCVYKQYWPLYWFTHTDWFEHLSAWQWLVSTWTWQTFNIISFMVSSFKGKIKSKGSSGDSNGPWESNWAVKIQRLV